jgi:hypothetical protein
VAYYRALRRIDGHTIYFPEKLIRAGEDDDER